jgi:hypothetical protein
MEGLALTAEALIEVLSTYSSTDKVVPAVPATPGWFVVGAFTLKVSAKAVLALIGSVSNASLTMHARLFDLTALVPVSGTIALTDLSDAQRTSPELSLVGGHVYQMQVEVLGDAGDDNFGSVKSLQLVSP